MHRICLFFCCAAMWLATAHAVAATSRPLVVASIEPLSMLAREFYGDAVEVKTLLLPSQNPHHAAFSPQQLSLLQQADLILWLGADAEPYLSPFLRKKTNQVAALEQPQVASQVAAEDHESGAHPVHLDPHFWTDPVIMAALLPALKASAPTLGLAADSLDLHAQQLQTRLATITQQARDALAPVSAVPWISYHDPWNYLVARTGLSSPLTLVPQVGGDVASRHFASLSQQVAQQRVGCAMVEPEARLALINKICRAPDCHQVALDPLGRDHAGVSYSQWWQVVIAEFSRCLQE